MSRGDRAALVGARLYLPEEWIDDPKRCRQAGIPEAEQTFRTKNQMARELIAEATANGVEFGWVAFDAGYGRDQDLLAELEAQGKFFMADVDSGQLVWLERPEAEDRPGNLREAGARPVDGIRRLDPGRPREVVLRQGENGKVKAEVQCRRVWIWPESAAKPLGVWLVISRLAHGKIKFSLSNAPVDTSWEDLACRQGQRFFIERCFEDSKSNLGMAEYQIRKWRAWHRHMVLVAVAGLFVMRERAEVRDHSPLTSVRDVVELIAWYFTGPRSQDEVVQLIHQRHARREKTRRTKLRLQRKREKMDMS